MSETDTTRAEEESKKPHGYEFRAVASGFELRDEGDGNMPTLVGNLPIGEWAEIRSAREGHFMERIAPGAFTKTVQENSGRLKVLFQHGRDPSVGEKPLGSIRNIEIDENNLRYEVELLDTSYNRDLMPGLERGLYGSSFRFESMREDFPHSRGAKSDYNPKGLRERTIQELRMPELGPVTFSAYGGAKSGLRSVTDEFATSAPVFLTVEVDGERMTEIIEKKADLLENEGEQNGDSAPAPDRAETPHPVPARRAQPLYGTTIEEEPAWLLR